MGFAWALSLPSLSFTFHRTDETIGDQFTIQEGVLNEKEDDTFQLIPGFGTLLPLISLIGAAFFVVM